MYTVSFVGLNYFNACKVGEQDALIPNGTKVERSRMRPFRMHSQVSSSRRSSATPTTGGRSRSYRPIRLEIKLGEFRTVNVIEFRIPQKPKPETPRIELNFHATRALSESESRRGTAETSAAMDFVLDDHPTRSRRCPCPAEISRCFASAARPSCDG